MASIARLATPVSAIVIQSFGSFKENEQVVINRVTRTARMYGISGRQEFVPFTHVDEKAQTEIRRQLVGKVSAKS